MSSPQQKQNIHFVYLTDPTKDSAISSHKAAKSHAARHGHARVRRQRMNEYQQQKGKHEGGNQVPRASASDSAVSAGGTGSVEASSSSHANEGGREIILYPPRASQPLVLETSTLSSFHKNVYSVHGLEFNRTEQFLLHHCKYLITIPHVLSNAINKHGLLSLIISMTRF